MMSEFTPESLYEATLRDVISQFIGSPAHRVRILLDAIVFAQNAFVAMNPEYVALKEPRIIDLDNGHFSVDAPICTLAYKLEHDRLLASAQAEIDEMERRQTRQRANLIRAHRKLSRRHADNLPPATRSIWGSLDLAQQYAILKDMDWAKRHAGEPGGAP